MSASQCPRIDLFCKVLHFEILLIKIRRDRIKVAYSTSVNRIQEVKALLLKNFFSVVTRLSKLFD